ncbi:glycosyltransferase [Candidatus Sumerlaeota bacterium]|nr:glycosyltransferase [Candidatus Sumerlaeota bacterium]
MTRQSNSFDIVCLSGLRWEETLFQRPQQLMKRLAEDRRVLYVANLPTREAAKSLLRARMRDFVGRCGTNLFYINVPYLPLAKRSRLLRRIVFFVTALTAAVFARAMRLRRVCLWLYYPAYVDHLGLLRFERLVYDCMDLFTGFRATAAGEKGIAEKETRLLNRADVVFTGGRSLHKARGGVNPRSFCLPSGVDYDHFHRAALDETPVPDDMKTIPRPILGYFGAVDERIDFALLDRVCAERPDWSVVLIGPRIADQAIPIDRPNFHFLGPRRYADLPGYLKAFDVCLMPFVSSDLTHHISPTKTPEYLAGGRPVVSTPIPDVIEDWGDAVAIAATPEEFIERIEAALLRSKEEPSLSVLRKVRESSWDSIAREMLRLIDCTARAKKQ